MKVELVSVTPNPEWLIIYIARNGKDKANIEKLVRYLIDNKHWSPFEHASMTVEITTSRAIATQILRHRSFHFQELSQRYEAVDTYEPIELRRQAEKNRQSSNEIFNPVVGNYSYGYADVIEYGDIYADDEIQELMEQSFELYKKLLNANVARECARFILPMATQTKLYMTGNVRDWIHYIALRTEEHTQKEHRDIALAIRDIFVEQFPVTGKALGWLS